MSLANKIISSQGMSPMDDDDILDDTEPLIPSSDNSDEDPMSDIYSILYSPDNKPPNNTIPRPSKPIITDTSTDNSENPVHEDNPLNSRLSSIYLKLDSGQSSTGKQPIQSDILKKEPHQPADTLPDDAIHDQDSEDDDESNPEELNQMRTRLKFLSTKVIVFIAIILIFIVVGVISTIKNKVSKISIFDAGQTVTSELESIDKSITESEKSTSDKETPEDTLTNEWPDEVSLYYDEYIELPAKYYTDEMVVTKFIGESNSYAVYYFSGIPKHFKRRVVFPVSFKEYNNVPSGGKITIDYKVITRNGKDIVTDVHTSLEA